MSDFNNILKQIEEDKENLAQLEKQKTTIDNLANTQKQTTTDIYNQQIKDTDKEYEDAYRENAVQKKVNEYYISEEMANMGLTNSGLNRTQITANQLSYANNKAKIDRQRQSMVDGLTREMTSLLTEIENSRASSLQKAEDDWNSNNMSTALEIHNSQLEAETEQAKSYYNYLSNQQSLTHGLTTAQINKLSEYLSKKDYVSAENYLDIYGDTLSNSDIKYWFGLFPDSYINGDRDIAVKYGDANGDGYYDVRDMVRAKKKSAAEASKIY